MCLAIPGKIESITGSDGDVINIKGKVNFGGILRKFLWRMCRKLRWEIM